MVSTHLDVLFVNLPPVSPDISSHNDATSSSHVHPPLGLLYLADSIKDKDFVNSYQCVDFAICSYEGIAGEKQLEEFVGHKLIHGGLDFPHVVCVSLMFSSAYDFFSVIVKQIKECWRDTTVVVGGIHASNAVEFLLKNNPEIDYVVCGEGEQALAQLLAMMAQGEHGNIMGVHSLDNIKKMDEKRFEMTAFIENINIDYTRYGNLLDMAKYTADTSLFSLSRTTIAVPSFAMMSSRGCPARCTFCASHTVHGRTSRWRDLAGVVDEIYWLNKTYGVKKIYLMDDNFVPKSKAIELFNTLAAIDIEGFELIIQNMSINHTDFNVIDAVAAARVTNIAFAIESGSKETQRKIKKFLKLDKAMDLVHYSQSKGLNVRCFYIIGFPGETVAEMQETIEYAKKLSADWSTFSVAVPIPGSEMYNEFVSLGYIEDGPASWRASSIRDRVFDTQEIGKHEIKELAFRANLDVNFVNNINIRRGDYENAEMIFVNFVKSFDFHIFAYDCLRRIYKETGRHDKENEIVARMKDLLASNQRAQLFMKYFDLLQDDTFLGEYSRGVQ